METPPTQPTLPADLEAIFATHQSNPLALLEAFLPVFCDHISADRIFLQPRNPYTRVCKVLNWRRSEDIPWPAIPGQGEVIDGWFIEAKWETEDPLWRAALDLQPSIYITSLPAAAADGLLNLDFETSYMFHTAFIHGHAHWPPLPEPGSVDAFSKARNFYGSVQPAVFDGPREWPPEVKDLVKKCLVRLAPVMKVVGLNAPPLERFDGVKVKRAIAKAEIERFRIE